MHRVYRVSGAGIVTAAMLDSNGFCRVSRIADDILRLKPSPYLGIDFEWDIRNNVPTILGVSDGNLTVSVEHKDGWPLLKTLLDRPNLILVGHNFLQADLQVMEKLGIKWPVDRVDDSIVWHWLTNPELCKAGGKAIDGDGDKRGRGFMNLYTAMMMSVGASNWKACVGDIQCIGERRPCPKHNVFGYNGNDAYWPVKAISALKTKAALRGVDWLYPIHRDLSVVMAKMTERGLLVDVEYVKHLEEILNARKTVLSRDLGFNPRSSKQIIQSFADVGISLKDSTEDTIRAAVEKYPANTQLGELLEWKELGNGSERWFAPKLWNSEHSEWEGYVELGYIHPQFALFTSSGRLASANPNIQNVAVRRGKEIRKAIIAPKGQVIAEADLSNAENRTFLWMAGYTDLPKIDLHSWVLELLGLQEDHPFAIKMGGARQAAKSVQHATNYGEGLVLLEEWQLRKSALIRDEIRCGARVVFEDWQFSDGGKKYCVSFTGSHLAERAFGSKSREHRTLALEVQEKYIARFPLVRQLQRKITRQIEFDRAVAPPSGLVTASYGDPADRIKSALALWGSQPVAMWTKIAMLKAETVPVLSLRAQIHDSLLFYVDSGIDSAKVKSVLEDAMNIQVPRMEGLFIPCGVKTGHNWGEMHNVH